MSLGHANGQVLITLILVTLDLSFSFRSERNSISAVHLFRDDLDLLLDGEFEVVEEFERVGRRARFNNGFTEIDSSLSSFSPIVASYGSIGTGSESLFLDESDFSRSVGPIAESKRSR